MYLAADIETGISSGPGDGAFVIQQYVDDAGNGITVYSDGSYLKIPPVQIASEITLAGVGQNLSSTDWTSYLALGLMGLAIFGLSKAR